MSKTNSVVSYSRSADNVNTTLLGKSNTPLYLLFYISSTAPDPDTKPSLSISVSERDISSSLSLQSRDTQEPCGAIIPLTTLGELGADQFTVQESSTRAAAGVTRVFQETDSLVARADWADSVASPGSAEYPGGAWTRAETWLFTGSFSWLVSSFCLLLLS